MSEGEINVVEADIPVEPLLRSHCYKNEYSAESQIAYLLQWFGEFGRLEKEDFLQEILHLYAPGQLYPFRVQQLTNEAKLPTLFDCRMILLKQWFAAWDAKDRADFLRQLAAADSNFFKTFDMLRDRPNNSEPLEDCRLVPAALSWSAVTDHQELLVEGTSMSERDKYTRSLDDAQKEVVTAIDRITVIPPPDDIQIFNKLGTIDV